MLFRLPDWELKGSYFQAQNLTWEIVKSLNIFLGLPVTVLPRCQLDFFQLTLRV